MGRVRRALHPHAGQPARARVYLFDLIPGGEEQIRPVLDQVLAGETVRVNSFRSEAG